MYIIFITVYRSPAPLRPSAEKHPLESVYMFIFSHCKFEKTEQERAMCQSVSG